MKDILTQDNSTVIPNDLIDKYMPLFGKKDSLVAVLDLIRQAYIAGLIIGRDDKNHETRFYRE